MSMPDLSTLSDEVRVAIEKAIADRDTRIAELEAAEEQAPVDVMKGLPDEVQKRFADLEKQHAATSEALAKERNERLTAEWIGKARAFESVLGDAEQAGPVLKNLPDTEREWLLEKLQQAETIIAKSPLFKELGKAEDGSARDEVETLAKAKRVENPKLSMAQARKLVRDENPELKRREREEGGQ